MCLYIRSYSKLCTGEAHLHDLEAKCMQYYLCSMGTWNPVEVRDAKGLGKLTVLNLDSKAWLGA